MSTKVPSSYFRKEARTRLQGSWVFAAEITLLFFAVNVIVQTAASYIFLLPLFLLPVINYGYSLAMLKISRGEKIAFEILFEGFSKKLWTIILAYLVITVRIFLWSLLLIIPGIIAAYSYSQTFFVLADKENVQALEAIEESKKLMKGHKWQLFVLSFTFIGWSILALLTLCIGYFWLQPYTVVTYAKFYDYLQKENDK